MFLRQVVGLYLKQYLWRLDLQDFTSYLGSLPGKKAVLKWGRLFHCQRDYASACCRQEQDYLLHFNTLYIVCLVCIFFCFCQSLAMLLHQLQWFKQLYLFWKMQLVCLNSKYFPMQNSLISRKATVCVCFSLKIQIS